MDLKYLNTFRAVVEMGSFAKAADRLNYTQSAITFQMSQLEKELDTQLFEKAGRNMVLTQAGKLLVPYVNEVFASVDKLYAFHNDLQQCQGDLYIGAGETLLCYKLPAVLKEFHRQAPKAKLHLQSMNCYDIRDELLNGSLDLGVFYEDVGGFGSNLTVYPCGEYPLALVASQDIGKEYSDFITVDRRIPVSFIINETNCIFRQIFEDYLKEKSLILDHTIELWSIPTIKNLVKSDVGISYLPRFAVAGELAAGELVELPTAVSHPYIKAVCAHHKNKWISPLVQLFIDLCKGIE